MLLSIQAPSQLALTQSHAMCAAAPAGGDGGSSTQLAAASAAQQSDLAAVVADAIEGLLRLTLPSGNLRSSLGSDSDR